MSVTTKINFRTFQPPPNYTEKTDYSEEQLFVEDLNNEDNEVWLFQTPREFDSSALKSKIISLQGETIFQNENCLQKEKSHKISASTNSVNELDYQLLLPSNSKNGLFPVSLPFAGHMSLTETISGPSFVAPFVSPEKEKEDFSNLRQRYVPFGSGKPSPVVDKSDNSFKSKDSHPTSPKKRVSFKSPLAETQEANVPEEAANSYQQDKISPNKDNLHKSAKQNKLFGNGMSQENSAPKEVKSKKTKHNKLFLNDCIPSKEAKVSSEGTENALNSDDSYCIDAQKSHKIAKKNEVSDNDNSRDNSTKLKKSKKQRKSDKFSSNKHTKDDTGISDMKPSSSSSSALLAQPQNNNNNKPEITESIQQNTFSRGDQERFGNTSDETVSGSDSLLYDRKFKKKKRKSKEHMGENDLSSLETRLSSATQLIQSSERNLSPGNHRGKNSPNTKYSPTTDDKIEPSENKAEKQDSSYTDAQRSHKKTKRKKLSEHDGSQDDTPKSKKRKMSDKFRENAYVETDDFISEENLSVNDSLIKLEDEQSHHSSDMKDLNIVPSQGEVSGNGTKHMKSRKKKKKEKEFASNNASVLEDTKVYTPLIQCDKKYVPAHNDGTSVKMKESLKKCMRPEPFESASDCSLVAANDKSPKKKAKNSKKHKNLFLQQEKIKVDLGIVKREYESSHSHENISPKKKKQHNITESNENKDGLSDHKKENKETLSTKKHKGKKRKETGHHSTSEFFVEPRDDIIITTDKKTCINIHNIKQEILSDSSDETPTKQHKSKNKKAKANKQFEGSYQLPGNVKDCSSNRFPANMTERETLNIKTTSGLQTDKMVHLNLANVKKEFDIEEKPYKKHKKNKAHRQSEALKTAIKEEALSDSQTSNDETAVNHKLPIVVKQEVLSDCDNKVSIKQEHSSNICAPLATVIKKEIKSEPDSSNSVVTKHCKRKRSENSEESCLEDRKDISSNCIKIKKEKMDKRSKY